MSEQRSQPGDRRAGVVPLHPSETYGSAWNADEAAASAGQRQPPPCLSYRGGPLIAQVEPFLIFWGSAWTAQMDLIAQLEAFWQWVPSSDLVGQLAEYSVAGGAQIGPGRYAGKLLLPLDPPAPLSDAAIQQCLLEGCARASLPAPGPNMLYVLYTPPGVVVQQNGDQSCATFCGYHDATAAPAPAPSGLGAPAPPQLFYAVVPFPGCPGCLGPLDAFAALTVTSSHECAEALTDPVPGAGWYDPTYGEIGDVCAWQTRQVGPYTVQRLWSNAQRTCV